MGNRLTINKEAHLKGIGLHSGKTVSVKFKPAKVNTGIKFTRIDLPQAPSLVLGYSQIEKLGGESRQTNLSKNDVKIKTIEHLTASLWALSIDDIEIDLDGEEFPIMDGSSIEILRTLKDAGLKDLSLPKKTLDIKEPLFCEAGPASIAAFPSPFLKVSYLLDFEKSNIAPQYLSINFDNPATRLEIFEKELASARTFCFESEVEAILKRGLGKGGNCDNGLVVGKDGNIIKNKLRFKDEFVRHKLMDLIGDLFMLGIPVKGNFIGIKSGHFLNLKMVDKITSLINVNTSKVAAIPLKAMDFSKKELDINDIKKILPHRYPFLLIDRIIEIDKDKRIVGLKNVTANENFFEGHFPGMPVMPGVLMIEAMAQVGGLLLLNRPENIGKLAFFMSIDKAKFRKPVVPGDQLIIEVEFIKARSRIAQVSAKALVLGELVSEAELMFGVAPNE